MNDADTQVQNDDLHTDEATQVMATGKLMALDVGLARIGVAVCDPLQLAANPLLVIHRTSRRNDFDRIAELVDKQEIEAVICGLPLNMDGSEGSQARTTRKWAMRLAHALRFLLCRPIPIIFWDERLSTFTARELIAGQTENLAEDAAAAAVILQSYLEALCRGELTDYGQIVLPPKRDTA